MADEQHSLSRALTRPMRAMTRFLGNSAPPLTANGIPSLSHGNAIVDCALYVEGVRQPGDWQYAEALVAARRHRSSFVWLGLKEPDANQLADIAETFELHELAVEDA